jgi:hypothetical protein
MVSFFLVGCIDQDEPELGDTSLELSSTAERVRVAAIRDVAAGEGMTNGPLLAGIAQSETNLAHCWSEATWACKGPSSPSCGGGPVIAGASDGACSLRRGGLGMFQFDAGTHSDTLRRDGEEILLLEGNISHAVGFVADLIDQEVSGVTGRSQAIAWMNSIPMRAGDAKLEKWAAVMACRYNGCCSTSSTCTTRRRKYRDNALMHYNRYGAAFWSADPGCPVVPTAGRVIDEEDECFAAAGPTSTWRSVDTGFGGGSLWTMTTASATGANVGTWRLNFAQSGKYRVDVHLDGGLHGQSRQARYKVVHGNRASEVVLDQASAGPGFTVLGEFIFQAGGNQHIQLADNTGEPGSAQIELLFDAIQLTRTGDAPGAADGLEDVPAGEVVGCSAASRGGLGLGWLWVVAAAVAAGRRRRRGKFSSH